MKVVWFVNTEFPDVAIHFGRQGGIGGGWWMKMLGERLACLPDIELIVITHGYYYTDLETFSIGSVKYYCIPRSRMDIVFNRTAKQLKICRTILETEKPDLVHVFGSEEYWALAAQACSIPSVVRLQGVLNSYVRWFSTHMPLTVYLRYPTMIRHWFFFKIRLVQERMILTRAANFEGQTEWDEGIAFSYNSRARYFRNTPLLRPEFNEKKWDLSIVDRASILTIGSYMPYKGLHLLIESLRILMQTCPQCVLKIAGGMTFQSAYGAYCYSLIKKFRLEKNVTLLGFLDANGLADAMSRAHLFVLPSFDENESNSLLEAMSVGTPCVATAAGGIPTMVTNNVTARMVPPGQPETLALVINRLFADDKQCKVFSENARQFSLQRQNPEKIVKDTLRMYQEVIKDFSQKNS